MTAAWLVLLSAAAAPKLAAPDWQAVNVATELATFYAQHLAQQLRARGVGVVTAQEIATLIGVERQRELLGCTEESASCLTELGSALGCDGTLVVNLAKLEDLYQANLKVLSAKTGQAIAETSVRVSGEKALLVALDEAAVKLADSVLGPPMATPVSLRHRAWIPGGAGVVLAVTGAVLLAVAGGTYAELQSHLGMAGQVDATAESLARTGSALQVSGWAGLGVGLAALAAGVLMFVLGGAP